MKVTENYKLEIYETGDAAALTDGYNLSMYKLDDYLKGQQDQLNDHEERITSLEERMDTAEADIDALEDRMDDAERRLDVAEDDIDALEKRMDDAETRLDGHDVDITNINTNLDGVHADIDALQERVTITETRLDDHDTQLEQLQTDLDAAEVQISVVRSQVNTEIYPVLNSLSSQVDTQQTLVEQLTTRVSNVEGRIEVHDDEIDLLKTRVSRLEPVLLWSGEKTLNVQEAIEGETASTGWQPTDFSADMRPYRKIIIYGYFQISEGEISYTSPVTLVGYNLIDSGLVTTYVPMQGNYVQTIGATLEWGGFTGYLSQIWTQESEGESQTLASTDITIGGWTTCNGILSWASTTIVFQKVYGIGSLEAIAA